MGIQWHCPLFKVRGYFRHLESVKKEPGATFAHEMMSGWVAVVGCAMVVSFGRNTHTFLPQIVLWFDCLVGVLVVIVFVLLVVVVLVFVVVANWFL